MLIAIVNRNFSSENQWFFFRFWSIENPRVKRFKKDIHRYTNNYRDNIKHDDNHMNEIIEFMVYHFHAHNVLFLGKNETRQTVSNLSIFLFVGILNNLE